MKGVQREGQRADHRRQLAAGHPARDREDRQDHRHVGEQVGEMEAEWLKAPAFHVEEERHGDQRSVVVARLPDLGPKVREKQLR